MGELGSKHLPPQLQIPPDGKRRGVLSPEESSLKPCQGHGSAGQLLAAGAEFSPPVLNEPQQEEPRWGWGHEARPRRQHGVPAAPSPRSPVPSPPCRTSSSQDARVLPPSLLWTPCTSTERFWVPPPAQHGDPRDSGGGTAGPIRSWAQHRATTPLPLGTGRRHPDTPLPGSLIGS